MLLAFSTEGISAIRAVVNLGFLTTRAVEAELGRNEVPTLRSVVPVARLIEALPSGICQRLMAIPVRADALTGTIDVAAVDPLDPHIQSEFSFHLKAPVRVVRAPLATMEEALLRLDPVPRPASKSSASMPAWRPERPTPPYQIRPNLDDLPPASMPRLRVVERDEPIPLVRRSPDRAAPNSTNGPSSRVPTQAPPPSLGAPGSSQAGSIQAPQASSEAAPRTADWSTPAAGPASVRPSQPLTPPMLRVVSPATAEKIEPEVETRRAAMVGPPTRPQGFSPRAPRGPFPLLDGFLAAIRVANSREEIVGPLLEGLNTVAAAVGVLVVRKGEFQGWRCNDALADQEAFRALKIRADVPSLFATAAATGFYLGPIPKTPTHAPLVQLLGESAAEVSATPVRVSGKLALMVFLHDLGDTMLATRRSEDLARAAGDALARLVKK
ncbi:MAG: hypothetical protein U0165_07340 [Polyangiaceae bacterium]